MKAMHIGILIVGLSLVACTKTSPGGTEATAQLAMAGDECPPLAVAKSPGFQMKPAANETWRCAADKAECGPIPLYVGKNTDGTCYVHVKYLYIEVKAKQDAGKKGNEGKKRSDVERVTWELKPDSPDIDVSKFEFHEIHGIRFLRKKDPNEEDDLDSTKDFKDGARDGSAQKFSWKALHLRKTKKLRYCPYVYQASPKQDCGVRDPFISNQ